MGDITHRKLETTDERGNGEMSILNQNRTPAGDYYIPADRIRSAFRLADLALCPEDTMRCLRDYILQGEVFLVPNQVPTAREALLPRQPMHVAR